MTISSAVNKVSYTANGTSKNFTVPFYFIYKSDLKVYRMNGYVQELLTLDTDYTIIGTPEQQDGSIYRNGGTVVMSAMPTAGTRFVILREVPLTQEADYQEGSTFPAALHELALDKLTMAVQQLEEKTDRAVTVDVFSGTDPSSLVSEIETIYNIKDEVVTVAENSSRIKTCSESIAAIIDAPNQANLARNSAIEATNSAVTAQLMSDLASENATAASASAGAAEQSAVQAGESAAQAVAALSLHIGDIGTALYVDETTWLRRRLNGQVIAINDHTQAFLNYLKGVQTTSPSLFTTESNWQSEKTLSKLGQCGKFVIDETAGTIRLPAVVNINGLMDLANAGVRIDESLPNIAGTVTQGNGYSVSWNAALQDDGGALYGIHATTMCANAAGTSGSFSKGFGIDASRSSSTYQDNAPVQQEAIQYPYFIQINTGSETTSDITNEQVLNNPFSFGDSKYSPIELDNISWLRSQGQWNSKAVYPAYYDWLLQKRNEEINTGYALKQNDTVIAWVLSDNPQVGDNGYFPSGNAGAITSVSGTTITVHNTNDNSTVSLTLDVSTTAQLYILPENGTGFITKNELDNWSYPLSSPNYCWVINSSDETFRLPVKTLTARGSRIVGNGMTLGLTDSVNNGGLFATSTSPNPIKMMTGVYGSDVGVAASGVAFSSDKGIGVTTDPTKSGIETSSQDLYLYFYVGETVQNADLIDAGRMADSLATVIPNNSDLIAGYGMPSDRYVDLTFGASGSTYTAPASGWFQIIVTWAAVNSWVWLRNGRLYGYCQTGQSGATKGLASVQAKKGEVVELQYNAVSGDSLVFIYAEGSN